ncbi:unnamed protein product [Adineta ricciae]|uniref:Uncharacterized protein n=1 Tax=Adineta ricciae TaxID=249248 RepID=A0A815RN97_ADIRI|nr:unnamed protein product [Adineta ricciae]CAF1658916.1 unnamed protein product [Adineta ricciae]
MLRLTKLVEMNSSMGPYVSKVSNYDTQIITYNLCDAAKLLKQLTAVINEKVRNGVRKLMSILTIHNTVMLINMLLLLLMIVAVVIWCLFQHCRSTAVEIGVVDEPPAYSIDTTASAKKSPEKK